MDLGDGVRGRVWTLGMGVREGVALGMGVRGKGVTLGMG